MHKKRQQNALKQHKERMKNKRRQSNLNENENIFWLKCHKVFVFSYF